MLNVESPLLQAERRSWKYWSEDGIPYLTGGLCCVGFGVLLLVVRHYRASPWTIALAMGFVPLCLLGSRRAMELLKARLTWPRAGYASTPFFAGLRAPVEPLVISIGNAEAGDAELYEFRRKRYRHMMWLLAAQWVAVNVALFAGLRGMPVVWAMLGLGAALTLYGLTRLLLFLHRHPLERA